MPDRRQIGILSGVVAGLVLAVAGGLGWQAGVLAPKEGPDPVTTFLDRFWEHPIPPQGAPPAGFTPLEASMGPEGCRSCHPDRFAEWSNSLHSQTMGAGIRWQLRVKTPAQGKRCMRCHAPLAEQKALVARELGWDSAPAGPVPDYVPEDLHRQGLVCAGCHVRRHRRYGPPAERRLVEGEAGPHNGFREVSAFQDSRFCASCHQFPPDGPSLAGKLRENTFREWQASAYAERGVSCQDCHMPEGRHSWRGIHDPGMVREAVSVDLAVERGPQGQGRARARVTNSGAGHHFPTYLTPAVTARLVLEDGQGREQREIARHVIAWKADVEMTRELFDTRLPAGESALLVGGFPWPEQPGWEVVLRLRVAPQAHYERLFRYMLRQQDKMDDETQRLLHRALEEARATRFAALEQRRPLEPAPPPGP